jgi:hypothetical protein
VQLAEIGNQRGYVLSREFVEADHIVLIVVKERAMFGPRGCHHALLYTDEFASNVPTRTAKIVED